MTMCLLFGLKNFFTPIIYFSLLYFSQLATGSLVSLSLIGGCYWIKDCWLLGRFTVCYSCILLIGLSLVGVVYVLISMCCEGDKQEVIGWLYKVIISVFSCF